MGYLGNTPTTQSFTAGTDYFNGTGSQTAFTLTRSVNSVNDIQVTVNNVVQQPNDAYTVSGTTLTMTSAPSSGTNNVYVRYLSTTTQTITPSSGVALSAAIGTASSPSYSFAGDSNTGIFSPAADTIAFAEGGTEVARIDSSGNVGIGATNPGAKLDVRGQGKIGSAAGSSFSGTLSTGGLDVMCGSGTKAFQVWDDNVLTTPRVCVERDGDIGIGTASPWSQVSLSTSTASTTGYFGIKDPTYGGDIRIGKGEGINNNLVLGVWSNNEVQFYTNSTERMRISSGGNVLVGCTSVPSGSSGGTAFAPAGAYGVTRLLFSSNNTATIAMLAFDNPNGNVGSIGTSGSSTYYATSSDYRLKENIAPMAGALNKVAQLKPCTYTWKADGTDGQGFIAHELQEVVPDAVVGEKDAVDANGKIIPQSIDTSFLVATLTAAIQELNEKVEAQAAEIAALKGANNAS